MLWLTLSIQQFGWGFIGAPIAITVTEILVRVLLQIDPLTIISIEGIQIGGFPS